MKLYIRLTPAGLAAATLSTALLLGCAPTDTMRIDATAQSQAAQAATTSTPENPADLAQLEQLWSERQNSSSQNDDYPIGPGDVLTISVPDVEHLAQQRVRVSTRGTIQLPLIGVVQASGLSEDGLAVEIDNKLQKYMYNPQATVFVEEYRNRDVAVVGAVNHPGLVLLNNPAESLLDVLTQAGGLSGAASNEVILIPVRPGTVSMSQQLASVIGRPLPQTGQSVNEPVNAPGSGMDSVGERFVDAGAGASSWNDAGQQAADVGSTGSAGLPSESSASSLGNSGGSGEISAPAGLGSNTLSGHSDAQFAPGVANQARGAINPNHLNSSTTIASGDPAGTADEAMKLAGGGQAITINLKASTLSGPGKYMNLPMRPGDVLIVPGGGDVMVVGWVPQPGRFQAGSGLTVLGAIGAAGGPMYAANTRSIALIRTAKNGSKVTIPIDMEKITSGEAPDIPVQANDVIDVPYSGLRIGPYIFYSIMTRMGIGGPMIPY
jgi:protein involved in polysaccharide export with SLBB domain